MADLEGIYSESRHYLIDSMLPFWEWLRDDINGGYYGLVTDDLTVHKDADKGCILNSRILWFFSSVYLTQHEESALNNARHAYRFLKDAFLDKEEGGLYWSVTADGRPSDDGKHCFCQAYGIYALAAYAEAEGLDDSLSIRDGKMNETAEEAMKLAYSLYDLIEGRMRDSDGYLEAFDRHFDPVKNEKLSEDGVEPGRTLNTVLHVMEAYTQLYRADQRQDVKEKLYRILDLFLDRIYIPERFRLGVFFDRDYNPIGDIYSYGHDIEASWLIDQTLDTVKDYLREREARRMTRSLAVAVYDHAYRESPNIREHASVLAESVKGVDRETRVWWVQCEALVGFLNAAAVTFALGDYKAAMQYSDAADRIWNYIRDVFIDSRPGGEWYNEVSPDGIPDRSMNIVDEWKCPYHNGRMFMEIMRRVDSEEGGLGKLMREEGSILWKTDEEGFAAQYKKELVKQERLMRLKNEPLDDYNGVLTRYKNPVLTRDHVPLIWRYDLNPSVNPLFIERLGINAVFNSGAIYLDGKYCLVARVEGADRKSFFAVAESDNGIDNFRFRDFPCVIGEAPGEEGKETNVYDMRLTKHEDGWIYGVFCSESKDETSDDLSAAVAAAGIVRTKDLETWERLPNLITKNSPQQRNVVLHPAFVDGQYAFYTRPMDDFIETGSGSGIGFGLCDDITHAVIDEEKMTSIRKYHQITEAKNGEGIVPIKTRKGWIHIAHGVRNTAAGLRYVLYAYATDLSDPTKVIAEPGGLLLGPRGWERVGDVSNVVFSNGCIVRENGDVYLYYAGSDTRMYVATTTIERLVDYVFNNPPDAERSVKCVEQRIYLIKKNKNYLEG